MSLFEHLAVLVILIIALGVGVDVANWLGGPLPAAAYSGTLIAGYVICVLGTQPFRRP